MNVKRTRRRSLRSDTIRGIGFPTPQLTQSYGRTGRRYAQAFTVICNSLSILCWPCILGNWERRQEAIRSRRGAARFNTIAADDGIAMGHIGMRYSLASRIYRWRRETMLRAHCLTP